MKVVVFDRMEECTETEVNRMLPLVSDQRREQALRYKHTMGQFCCLKSWGMLRDILKTPTKPRQNPDQTPIEWQKMEYNEQGKPFLPDGPFFSISHCKAGIAVAVDEQPIGIDIESIRHADKDLIERTMNEEEQRMIRSAAQPDRMFTRLWTQKEAVVKAEGTGICSCEQLQTLLPDNKTYRLETIEKEKYIYTIAYKN
ncbi:MAG: 4'-phosphopantetheinyl transferase superfamily protein [Paludibacteraceae bacterium]|nr:4'-phosphopantetheinyl transferase superfamily protein [Paludibacteraceae bacterium]